MLLSVAQCLSFAQFWRKLLPLLIDSQQILIACILSPFVARCLACLCSWLFGLSMTWDWLCRYLSSAVSAK